jgi:hypothetical protein
LRNFEWKIRFFSKTLPGEKLAFVPRESLSGDFRQELILLTENGHKRSNPFVEVARKKTQAVNKN